MEDMLGADRQLNAEHVVKGSRMVHPTRGAGIVTDINLSDRRNKPFEVTYDTGEVHRYGTGSTLKLVSDVELRLVKGTRVIHPTRGSGVIATLDYDDSRHKPFVVQYDNGEIHHYSVASATKLTRVDESDEPVRRSRTPEEQPTRGPIQRDSTLLLERKNIYRSVAFRAQPATALTHKLHHATMRLSAIRALCPRPKSETPSIFDTMRLSGGAFVPQRGGKLHDDAYAHDAADRDSKGRGGFQHLGATNIGNATRHYRERQGISAERAGLMMGMEEAEYAFRLSTLPWPGRHAARSMIPRRLFRPLGPIPHAVHALSVEAASKR
jgi:hypothetical protein